jgi:hypothetical protein
MKIPHTTILKSFTATETFESPCGRGQTITVHTLTRENTRDKFWRYTATRFKTFKDGFDAPKMRRETWDDSTAADMIERFKTGEHCQCASAD